MVEVVVDIDLEIQMTALQLISLHSNLVGASGNKSEGNTKLREQG